MFFHFFIQLRKRTFTYTVIHSKISVEGFMKSILGEETRALVSIERIKIISIK